MSRTFLALGALALSAVLATEQGAALVNALARWPEALLGALALFAFLGAAGVRSPRALRGAYHWFANHFAVGPARRLSRVYVIDGDTIDAAVENGKVERFRLANIDAPETGENARCAHERLAGELATAEARAIVGQGAQISARRTWRIDRFGRRVAFVLVDGADLGESLVRTGFAEPWRGHRVRWCGRGGGLVAMAARRGEAHRCGRCVAWR